jgi:GTPase SAR1 family protein
MLHGETRGIKGVYLMKMIILSGAQNTGKTTTLHAVFTEIASGINPPPTKTPFGSRNDFEAIVFPYKGKTIAIFSAGDTLYEIEAAIQKYATQCDVLILAYSDKFRSDHKPKLFDLARQLVGNVQEYVIRKNEASDADNAAACKKIIENI